MLVIPRVFCQEDWQVASLVLFLMSFCRCFPLSKYTLLYGLNTTENSISAVCINTLEIYGSSHHWTVSVIVVLVSVTHWVCGWRGGACLEVGKGLPTYLFFSCEPFEQALLVNLELSKRARGGSCHLSLTGATVYMGTPGSGPGCSFSNCCEITTLWWE